MVAVERGKLKLGGVIGLNTAENMKLLFRDIVRHVYLRVNAPVLGTWTTRHVTSAAYHHVLRRILDNVLPSSAIMASASHARER